METRNTFENLSTTERAVRFAASFLAIVATLEISLAGGVFAAVNIAAIAVATTAIVGWDPVKAGIRYVGEWLQPASHRHSTAHG